MARSVTNAPVSARLQRVFDRTDEAADRLRKVYGESGETLAAFIREHLDRVALEEELDALLHGDPVEDLDPDARQDH